MPENWRSIRIELLAGGRLGELWTPPGRELVVGPRHTFRDLAAAIDDAFARRDRSRLWEFTLEDGRRLGRPDPDDDPEEWELPLADAGRLRVVDTVPPGGEFRCVYDLGDRWVHRCTVARSVDPRAHQPAEADPLLSSGWPRTTGPAPLHGGDLREIRGATARRDVESVRALLEGRDPGPFRAAQLGPSASVRPPACRCPW
jgi:hypothetical protein